MYAMDLETNMTFAWLITRILKHIAAFIAVLILAVYDFRFIPFIVIVYALSTLARGFDRTRRRDLSDEYGAIHNWHDHRG